MKFEWEAADIKPGRRVKFSTGLTEQFIIGYCANHPSSDNYALVSLTEGMFNSDKLCSKREMADMLNKQGLIPVAI